MFHSSHIHMPNRHRQRTALRTFFPSSSFSPPDSKEPLRRGILFSSVATVLLLVGAILTWLGFNDVFGGKISMTGPLLIALALLMLLLSFRQFMLARKRNRTTNTPVQMDNMNSDTAAPAMTYQEDINGTATIVVESWDNEEPNTDPIRNTDELAPPSYMDIAQSFNSNSPSFFSHEDHNEAPPTYEETCAGLYPYGSETSLTQLSSRHSETSPSPRKIGQQGFFQNDPTFVNSYDSNKQPRRSSNTLCPRAASSFSQRQGEGTTSGQQSFKIPLPSTDIALDSSQFSPSNQPALSSSLGSSGVPEEARETTAQWSRRSFSSIPSYTCLLSESGEVSAHVFNTSSIIEEMMPNGDSQGSSNIPTRSHSMSSVHVLRQGVPYNNLTPSQQTNQFYASPQLPHQPVHDQQSSFSASPISSNNISSPKLNSPTHHPQLRKASDSNILELLGSQSGSAVQPSQFTEFYSAPSLGTLQSALVDRHNSRDSPMFFGYAVEPHGNSLRESKINTDSHTSLGHGQVLDVQETI